MTEPLVGDIVHLLLGGRCYAAIVAEISDDGSVGLHPFVRMDGSGPGDNFQPYNSLSSARPTSGWHWIEEHE